MFTPNTPLQPNEDKLSALQRQSWQLELIITGFALAGLISGADEVTRTIDFWREMIHAYGNTGRVARTLLNGVKLAYFVVIAHLFLNVVVRCLWIGALGLRGFIGKEDYLKQGFHPVFDRFLRKRNGNFDNYINRLDTAANLIFAITFLMIAIIIGVMIWASAMSLLVSIFVSILGEPAGIAAGGLAAILFLLLSAVYLIDFITAGSLKRGESKVYFPLYRLMGWLTLARLYRPLYYAIISNKWGKRLIWLVVPYIVIITLLPSFTVSPTSYLNRLDYAADRDLAYTMNEIYYADKEGFIRSEPSIYIPSEIIREPVLKVTVPLWDYYKDDIAVMCDFSSDTLSVKEKISGSEAFGRRIGSFLSGRGIPLENPSGDSLMIACLQQVLEVSLDGKMLPPDHTLIHVSSFGYPLPEIVSYFPLDSLSPGIHRVKLRTFGEPRKQPGKDVSGGISVLRTYVVPFYYAPEG